MADERTRRVVEHGRRIRSLLIQTNTRVRSLAEQSAGLLALGEHLLDPLAPAAVEAFKEGLGAWLAAECPDIVGRIEADGALDEAELTDLLARLRRFVGGLAP